MLTLDQLAAIVDRAPNDNMRSVIAGLELRGEAAGLNLPHRAAHYAAQLAHESAGFRYDREIWGPTAAQKRYDLRTDLGNTAALDGDGRLYAGRGPIQVTGGANYRAFTRWARAFDPATPDFSADPDRLNTDPWEGLSPIWFWERNGLNRYADEGDAEMVTRTINGGLNGYTDRLAWLTRASLVLLGQEPDAVRGFQANAGLTVDGIAGPRTRAALHRALVVAGTAPVEPAAPPASAAAEDQLRRITAICNEA